MPELENVKQRFIARKFLKKIVSRKCFDSRRKFYALMSNQTFQMWPAV